MPIRWATERTTIFLDDALQEDVRAPRWDGARKALLDGSVTRLWMVGLWICFLAGVVLLTAREPYRSLAVACLVLAACGFVLFIRWYTRDDWRIEPEFLRFDGQAPALFLRARWGIRAARGLVLTRDGIELRHRGAWITREWSTIGPVATRGPTGRRSITRDLIGLGFIGRRELVIDIGGHRTAAVSERAMGSDAHAVALLLRFYRDNPSRRGALRDPQSAIATFETHHRAEDLREAEHVPR